MFTQILQKSRPFFDIFVILFICLTLSFIWFHKGLLFAGGEEGIPFYNLEKSYELFSYTWRDYSGGYPLSTDLARIPFFAVLSGLSRLSISPIFLQALTFFSLMITGAVAMFFLLKVTVTEELLSVFKKNNAYQLIPLVGAIFYLLNPYSLVQIWGRGLYNQFFPFAAIPLFLALYIQGLKKKKVIYGLMALLTSLLLSTSFGQPGYVICLWLAVFVYTAFKVILDRNFKSAVFSVSYFTGLLIGWIAIHSWWILPLIKTLPETTNKIGDLEYNLGTLRGISKDSSFDVVIRLIHKFINAGIYGDIYSTKLFVGLSWIIPIVSLASLKFINQIRHLKYFLLLFGLSLFLVMGTNSPLGFLFEYLFKNIHIFQVFRNSYEKAGLLLLISYTPLFSLGVVTIFHKFLLFIALFLVSGIYVWPLWTNQFAGGTNFNPWVEVPSYYQQADDWIVSQDKNSRIIQFPLNPGDRVRYKWEHSYQGIEPSEFLFSNSSIGRNIIFGKPYYNVLLQRLGIFQKGVFGPDPDISTSEFRSSDLYKELNKLGVRYIVLHRDLDEKFSGLVPAEEASKYLLAQKGITKKITFGLLDIYEVQQGTGRVYSDDINLVYQRISPTQYLFKVENATKFAQIVFQESFDPNWQLFIDDKPVSSHSKAFSYANMWSIEKLGTYNGTIKYKPQDSVDMGLLISKISSMAVIIAILFISCKPLKIEKHMGLPRDFAPIRKGLKVPLPRLG